MRAVRGPWGHFLSFGDGYSYPFRNPALLDEALVLMPEGYVAAAGPHNKALARVGDLVVKSEFALEWHNQGGDNRMLGHCEVEFANE